MSDPVHRTKMTFRLDPELARAIRQLPRQTAFVEAALRDALGRTCPLCEGTGTTPEVHMAISDLKGLPPEKRIDRQTALQLKALVRLGRALLATQLEIAPAGQGEDALGFRLARQEEVLLAGRLQRGDPALNLTH